MKRILAVGLAISMMVSLAACGGASTTSTTAASEAATSVASTTAAGATDTTTEAAASGKKFKVAMVCDSSISDGGWGAACYNAMTSAAEDLGWETQYMDSIAQSDYASSMEGFCQAGFDMIFLPGNQYSDATVQVAKDYPDIAFAVLNGAETLPTDNIVSILPNADEIGYLAGALAGLMTKTKVLGFIGGMEIDTTKQKLAGYLAAAQVVDPSITVKSAYAGSFSDTAKGMELATSMINEKADVFFGDASAVDSGARQAIDSANTASGSVSVYDIGQPADLLGQNACIISSVLTDNAGMLKLAMQDVESKSFGNKVIYGSIENGCLNAGKFSEELVSADMQKKYAEYVEQIKAGTFITK